MSAVCAAAPSISVLIICRVLQGAFGALLIPQGIGMLKETFEDDEMGKVFGVFGPMLALSGLVAPILAGVLIETDLWGTGWRLVFLINVPVGIAAFAGAVKVLPRTVSHPGIRLDVVGMLLVGGALSGMDVRIVAPEALWNDDDVVQQAREIAAETGGSFTSLHGMLPMRPTRHTHCAVACDAQARFIPYG